MALGVIARKCGSLRPVLAGPTGCLRSRWRSGFRKWRHDAVSRARGREAPRTCRCIKTFPTEFTSSQALVGKRRAPVGALRLLPCYVVAPTSCRREAPRTCRCIKTLQKQRYRASISGQQAPRTCRCIKTTWRPLLSCNVPPVSKHRAPVGALRRKYSGRL